MRVALFVIRGFCIWSYHQIEKEAKVNGVAACFRSPRKWAANMNPGMTWWLKLNPLFGLTMPWISEVWTSLFLAGCEVMDSASLELTGDVLGFEIPYRMSWNSRRIFHVILDMMNGVCLSVKCQKRISITQLFCMTFNCRVVARGEDQRQVSDCPDGSVDVTKTLGLVMSATICNLDVSLQYGTCTFLKN